MATYQITSTYADGGPETGFQTTRRRFDAAALLFTRHVYHAVMVNALLDTRAGHEYCERAEAAAQAGLPLGAAPVEVVVARRTLRLERLA